MIIANALFANEKDTLKAKLSELNVSADKLLSNSAYKYSAISVINKKQIEKQSPWQISEILDLAPGIFINNYGGLGGLKTISIRGTSSNQTLVMINGVKINSNQSGIVDFSKFPVSFFDEIEVVRGGASALFGANALGGIINLRTKSIESKKIKIFSGINFGSFEQQEEKLSISFHSWGISSSLFYNHTKSKGNYPVNDKNDNFLFNRQNSSYDNYSIGLINTFNKNSWNNSLLTLINLSDRGIPGAINQEQTKINPSDEHLNEKNAIIIFNSKKKFDDNSEFNIGLNSQIDYFDYTDPDFLGDLYDGLKSQFTNRNIGLTLRYSTILSSFITDLGLESSFSDLRGNQLDKSIGDYVKRSNLALMGRMENNVDLFNYLNITYNFGLRFDYFSDIYTAVSPMTAAIINFRDLPFNFKLNWSYNFRPPSFNEMYYLNFGNSDLKPERSISYNLGFNWFENQFIDFDFNMFYINTSNQIVAIPKNQISWTAQNIVNVKTKGMEINIKSFAFDKSLEYVLSYTLQKAINNSKESFNSNKMLAYVPEEILTSSLNYNFSSFDLGTVLKYSSYYYSLPDNSYVSLMSSYFTVNAYLIYNFKLKNYAIKFRLDFNNLLDEQYSIINNYPMPGRYFRLGSSIMFN